MFTTKKRGVQQQQPILIPMVKFTRSTPALGSSKHLATHSTLRLGFGQHNSILIPKVKFARSSPTSVSSKIPPRYSAFSNRDLTNTNFSLMPWKATQRQKMPATPSWLSMHRSTMKRICNNQMMRINFLQYLHKVQGRLTQTKSWSLNPN